MKLKNPFTDTTRNLWLDHWECADCGTNGNGMLELHHITGRDSNATLNGVVVCHECHSHYGHNRDEEQRLFAKNLSLLVSKHYALTDNDVRFMEEHSYLIQNNPYLKYYGI
jgi:hypothetical protein